MMAAPVSNPGTRLFSTLMAFAEALQRSERAVKKFLRDKINEVDKGDYVTDLIVLDAQVFPGLSKRINNVIASLKPPPSDQKPGLVDDLVDEYQPDLNATQLIVPKRKLISTKPNDNKQRAPLDFDIKIEDDNETNDKEKGEDTGDVEIEDVLDIPSSRNEVNNESVIDSESHQNENTSNETGGDIGPGELHIQNVRSCQDVIDDSEGSESENDQGMEISNLQESEELSRLSNTTKISIASELKVDMRLNDLQLNDIDLSLNDCVPDSSAVQEGTGTPITPNDNPTSKARKLILKGQQTNEKNLSVNENIFCWCGHPCKSSRGLTSHSQKHKNVEECPICKKTFKKRGMRMHLASCAGKTPNNE